MQWKGGLTVRLLICAGGTGGGVNPALAVLQALGKQASSILWVGSQHSMEAELVSRAGITFQAIPAAQVHGIGIFSLPRNLIQLFKGYYEARKIIEAYQPEVLFFTGGYVAVPVALAARHLPILLYTPDIEPGWALKFLARFSNRIALTSDESAAFYSQKASTIVSGYPVRNEIKGWERSAAMKHLGLNPDLPVLLVMGGSLGARSINRTIISILPQLLDFSQVIHVSGKLDWEEVKLRRETLPTELALRFHTFPYLHEDLGAALSAANLVVSRAGASILGEYPLYKLPAILVPYPYAWRYQHTNASFLEKCGAGMILENNALEQELLPLITGLLKDKAKLAAMSEAMGRIYQPQAAEKIATAIVDMQNHPNTGGER
jgi:UDP-N-acetylglucosamine--N-acetylmuramyl-(pentapeptide) pyrophosphoryl-undecaprenol N-acetylglucosamine transferase